MNDDMSFCMDECKHTECERHPSNIVERSIPHSYMHFKGTEFCQRMTRKEAIAYGREQLKVFGGLHREFIELAIEAHEKYEEAYEHGWTEAESKYREILDRKHGKWLVYREDEVTHYCSNCKQLNSWGEVPFCPWCGADMRERREDV